MTAWIIKCFIKDHENIHNPRVRERYGHVAGVTGIVTNLLLVAIKLVFGLISGSIAILADAVNNLSDSASSLVTVIGFRLSGKPADAEHPYGHARMEYVSGLVVSFVIVFLGLQLLKSSFEKILQPQTAEFGPAVLAALVVAIGIKIWQASFYRRIGRLIDSITLTATSADSRNDVLATTTVLAAAILARLTGLNLDGWMGMAVAAFILYSGVRLVMETVNPLLGAAPTGKLVREISERILSYEGIIGLHDLMVHSYGAGECYASVHCELPAEQDIMVSHDIIDNIEREFMRERGIHLVIHLDPVVTNDPKTNELKQTIAGVISGISPGIGMHDFRVVWGISHSNIIFDIIVPYGFGFSDRDLVEMITERVQGMNPTWYPVITVDHVCGSEEQAAGSRG